MRRKVLDWLVLLTVVAVIVGSVFPHAFDWVGELMMWLQGR
jgi:K+-transporting ATPase c subunit